MSEYPFFFFCFVHFVQKAIKIFDTVFTLTWASDGSSVCKGAAHAQNWSSDLNGLILYSVVKTVKYIQYLRPVCILHFLCDNMTTTYPKQFNRVYLVRNL